MSNFACEICSVVIIDSAQGYTAECVHYPPDIKPLRGFGMHYNIATGAHREWFIDEYGTKRWVDNNGLFYG